MIILYIATFVLQLIFIVLVGNLHEDIGKDHRFWIHANSTLTRNYSSVAHIKYFHATLIIPISARYYSELRCALMPYSRVNFLLTTTQ